MLVDYHVHPLGHLDRELTEENITSFLQAAENKGIKEIGFADHNQYFEEFKFDVVQRAAKGFSNLKVRQGIEMDYIPDQEEEIEKFLEQFELDYVIGSVHKLDDWLFDHPDYKAEYKNWDLNKLYHKYFTYIQNAAESGLFDIIGHFDLIKIFDFKPKKSILEIVAPVLEVIAQNDMVLEINTNGLNKPVAELYPNRKILEQAYQLGIEVILSSDAHVANRVGENLDLVRKMLLDIGYTKIATFSNRKRNMVKL